MFAGGVGFRVVVFCVGTVVVGSAIVGAPGGVLGADEPVIDETLDRVGSDDTVEDSVDGAYVGSSLSSAGSSASTNVDLSSEGEAGVLPAVERERRVGGRGGVGPRAMPDWRVTRRGCVADPVAATDGGISGGVGTGDFLVLGAVRLYGAGGSVS
jgi:hypothetical protein